MNPRVAFQGELGAFSELAIRQQWPTGAVPVPCRTFPDAIAAVRRGNADHAVIPVENAIVGAVKVALDALRAADIEVMERPELRVPIHLCLLAPRGATLAEERVHDSAIAPIDQTIAEERQAVDFRELGVLRVSGRQRDKCH